MRWTKDNWPKDRWPNFAYSELACTHTGQNNMTMDTMDRLQLMRTKLGRPITISSGYRHITHPVEARKPDGSGNPRGGAHYTGRAVDVAVRGAEALRVLEAALEVGFTGIGVKQAGEGRFIHLDDIQREDNYHVPRPWIWSY